MRLDSIGIEDVFEQQTVDALRQEWLKRGKPESGFDKWLEESVEIYEPLGD